MYAPGLFQHTHKHTDACSYWSITEGFARCLLLFLYSNFVLVWKFQCFVGRKDPERPDLMRKWHQERKKKVWLQSHENPAAFLLGWKGELGGLSMLSNWSSCSHQSLSFHSYCKKSAQLLPEPFVFNCSSHLQWKQLWKCGLKLTDGSGDEAPACIGDQQHVVQLSVQSECSLPQHESSFPDVPPIRMTIKMINPPSSVGFHTWGDSIPAQVLPVSPTGMFYFQSFLWLPLNESITWSGGQGAESDCFGEL